MSQGRFQPPEFPVQVCYDPINEQNELKKDQKREILAHISLNKQKNRTFLFLWGLDSLHSNDVQKQNSVPTITNSVFFFFSIFAELDVKNILALHCFVFSSLVLEKQNIKLVQYNDRNRPTNVVGFANRPSLARINFE